VPPVLLRERGRATSVGRQQGHGLGGRSRPRADETSVRLRPGDRLVLVSDGVVGRGEGQAGLGVEGMIAAAQGSRTASAADTVRKIHSAVLAASGGELDDDATVVCLAVA
jgi:serine phosphatase RsbU (regulator of sigma subunit)